MTVDVLGNRERLRAVLSEFVDGIEIDDDGDLILTQAGQRMSLVVGEDHQRVAVSLYAVPARGLVAEPVLFRWVATQAHHFRYGALSVVVRPDARADLVLRHAAVIDGLDDEGIRACLLPAVNTVPALERDARALFLTDRD